MNLKGLMAQWLRYSPTDPGVPCSEAAPVVFFSFLTLLFFNLYLFFLYVRGSCLTPHFNAGTALLVLITIYVSKGSLPRR